MPRRQKTKPRMRSTLTIITALLVASAVVRLGADAGQAFAKTSEKMASEKAMTGDKPAKATSMGGMTKEEVSALIKTFQDREHRLEEREAALQDRVIALRVADEQISAKLAELEAAEMRLRDMITMAESASETDLDRLTKVYESMKPKQAAALFEEMDPNFAAGFLGRMRPEAAAQIMAGLSPQAAHMFSVVLAGRNANVPTE